MAFNTNRIWVTDTAASLEAANYDGATDVTTNGRAYVVDNFTLLPTGITNPGLRVDSGSITIAENEVILTHQDQNSSAVSENGILVIGGTLVVEGSADENSPHTFLETMGDYGSTSSGGIHHTGAAGLALSEGSIILGSVANPFTRIISHKSFTIDPEGADITGFDGGASSITIHTLILQNPLKDSITNDTQLPPLGFRESSSNYTVSGSSFDTVILDGFNILDVSAGDSVTSGMYPQNIVFRRASLLADNGSLAEGRANNLSGIGYAAVNGNESDFDLICNTELQTLNLANTNWFIIGNSDGPIRATRRMPSQRGGFVSNRLITVNTDSGGTDQRFWIPETNSRIDGTTAATGDITTSTAITGTDLGAIALNPLISDTVLSTQIPINGIDGRYSVVSGTPGTQLRLRTRMGWLNGGAGVTTPVVLAETHQDGEYIYFGTQDLVIGTQAISYYTQGVVDLEVSISDATDPVIDVLKAASVATTAIAGATVALPVLGATNTATTTVTLNEAADTNVSMGEIFATIKSAMVTRVGTGENTIIEATANNYVENWLNNIITGTATVVVENAGAGAVELRSDDAYNNKVNIAIGANVNGTVTAGNNVTLQTAPAVSATFNHNPSTTGGSFALFSRPNDSTDWTQIGTTSRTTDSTVSSEVVETPTAQYLSLWKPKNNISYCRVLYTDLTGGITEDAIYEAPTLNIVDEVRSADTLPGTLTLNWRAGTSGEGLTGQLVAEITGTNATALRLTNAETQAMMRQAMDENAYFDVITANVNTAEFLTAETDNRADFIIATSTITTSANGDFIELISPSGQQQGITALDNTSDTPMTGVLSAEVTGTNSGGTITFDAVSIADNPAGVSEAQITSAVNNSLTAVRENHGVLLTAIQRGSVKAATYSAGELK